MNGGGRVESRYEQFLVPSFKVYATRLVHAPPVASLEPTPPCRAAVDVEGAVRIGTLLGPDVGTQPRATDVQLAPLAAWKHGACSGVDDAQPVAWHPT